MIWKPNVTVAAVIERDGKFLLVEEETSQGVRFNSPRDIWKPTNLCWPQSHARHWKNPPIILFRNTC